MRHPRFVVGAALFGAALLMAWGAYARRPYSMESPARAPAWDRDVARREVLAAVLDSMFVHPWTRVLVIDETMEPDNVHDKDSVLLTRRPEDRVELPNGAWVLRPRIDGFGTETFEDWVAHTGSIPVPRDVA